MKLQPVSTDRAPKAIGPYSQAIIHQGLVFTSGQIPLSPDGTLVEGGIREQTHQVFQNIKAVLEEAGTDLNHVIKATVFLQDMNHFAEVNEIYATYFDEHRPARSAVEVSRLPKDVLIEIEVVAALADKNEKS